jgi:hypothetical protein
MVVLMAAQGSFGGHSITTGIPNFFYYKFWSKKTHFG